MIKLVGFAGSLRAGSFNRALLAAAVDAMPEGASLEALSIDAVPLYNADVEEQQGIPASVASIKDKIAAADGLLIATPEYNGGIPGIAKNVIDWISRPGDDQPRVTHGRPVALIGATPGGLGTALSQAAWLQVLRTLRMRVFVTGGPFYVSAARNSFDQNGVANDELKKRLASYLKAYVESIG
jgi:NAD(P)H-dependent FMN reductase